MATIRPFAAIRPPRQYAEQVSCLPYDVMNHSEACAMAAGNASSYLHICRADIDTSEAFTSSNFLVTTPFVVWVSKRSRVAS